MTGNVLALSAVQVRSLFEAGELSPVELLKAVLSRVSEVNPRLNALVTLAGEEALHQAKSAQERYAVGDVADKPLLGIPFTVKDNIPTKGVKTTGGSLLGVDTVPAENAPAVERAVSAGAIMLGKTNTPEFGWKGETTNRVFGTTRNPWDFTRTPGGSTGGGAACVASGIAPLAFGTDGAGSSRIPAAFTGVFGFKGTFGLIPMAPNGPIETLGHIGIITRSVMDAALLLSCVAGIDERDRLSLNGTKVDWRTEAQRDPGPMRVAWSRDLGYAPVEDEIAEIARAAAFAFTEIGAHVEEVDPGFTDPHDILYEFFAAGNAGMHRDNWSEVQHQVDPGRVEMIDLGFQLSAADIGAALIDRAKWVNGMTHFMRDYDLLLTPTVPITAFAAGMHNPPTVAGTDTPRFKWTPYTYGMNLTGQPAATVPCGTASDGLPVGLQLIGRRHDDISVLRSAAAFEALRPWTDVWPAAIGAPDG